MNGLGRAVRLVPWDSGRNGYDPRSCYSELFWLPVAGPTAWCALRRSAWLFEQHPDGFELQTADLARSLGVGTQTGPHGPLARTVARLRQLGLARSVEGDGAVDVIGVRRRLPALTAKQIAQLPVTLQDFHDRRAW